MFIVLMFSMFCLHTLSLDAWKWWMVYYCLNKFLASANGARFPFREFCETKLKNLENEPQHWIWAKQLGRSQLDDFTWSSVLVHLDDIRRAIFLFFFYSQPRWAFSKWYHMSGIWSIVLAFSAEYFPGPGVWVTTNQRTYKSEPVMARARWTHWSGSPTAISSSSKWVNTCSDDQPRL